MKKGFLCHPPCKVQFRGDACLRERLDDLIDPDSLRVSGVPTGVRKGEPGCYKHWTGPGGGPWAPPWGVIQGGP